MQGSHEERTERTVCARMALLLAHVGMQFTRFTGTKVQILKRMALLLAHVGAQFTRFTGTKVQILQTKRAATGARRYL